MKSKLRLPLITALCAFSIACVPTGNPNDDSIFFSPRMANKRLDEKRSELARIEKQTEAERITAITNKRRIGSTNTENSVKRAEIANIRSRIATCKSERGVLDEKIKAAPLNGGEVDGLVEKRASLESEISQLSRRLAILIDTY